ncbi:MAG TPA: PSD1 and planctomycete cytochrome C domain-containing protein [Chthoniobacteraceae bacterium]|nr:PSD1 and planctomycete cytochrome C domain-containing protein [Chthoniobacteraceae bacterium]
MRSAAPIILSSVVLCLAPLARAEEPAKPADPAQGLEFFESKIRPLLVDTCVECHGAKKQKGDLRLDSKAGWMKGGASGVVIVPGKPDDSLLVTAVRYWNKDLQMPPKHALEAPEVSDLVQWVKLGAPDPRETAPEAEAPKKVVSTIDFEKGRQHWSFQPVQAPAPPAVQDKAWVRNEIDAFTLARMEPAGVKPAPDAGRFALLRRVTYDLTGLPPTPEEIEAFLKDTAPDAYARVVDRLLASPRYGEAWGRHWLDVVRYADTCGNASDYPVPQAYLYRNYVLQAFNDDVPFDRFVREQIAGDLLPFQNEEERKRNIIATGYVAAARHFAGGEGEPHLTLEDAIDNMGRAFLGLSVACARCHDHKFDPISSHDYYALYGILSSTVLPHPGGEGKSKPERLVPLVSKAEAEADDKARATALAAIEPEFKTATEAKAAIAKEPDSPERKERYDAAVKTLADVTARRGRLQIPSYPVAYSISESTAPANTKLQVRGDPQRLGEEVPRGFLTVLGGQKLPPEEKGSGRLELAQWIADPANPLTARVIVNRIWQQHFGRGLVTTPNDFGKRGQAPTHPELLDFLAKRFVESGWSIKALHRLILNSHTWQQATQGGDTEHDATNALWSRFDRRRLEAEALRDTMLFVGGDLDFTPGGEHPFPAAATWTFTQHRQFFAVYDTNQRSVYQMQQRLRKHPFFALFDGADTNSSTPVRSASITALQSLFTMNDKFAHERADRLAAQIVKGASDDTKRIELAFLTLYGRPPEPDETALFLPYLADLRSPHKSMSVEQSWQSLARVLMSANEFLYLD